MSMNRFVVGVFSILFCASMALAQTSTGTILGVVKDTSGAVVAGAVVTITEIDTNQTRTVETADQGEFRVPALPTGHYSAKFEKSGFKTATTTGLTLSVAAELVVNTSLQVGSSTQEVTVTGEAPLVSTTTSSLGGLVDEQRISELPLNGRNYNDLTLLQPGVNQHVSYNTGAPGMIGTLYSSSGAPLRSNTYMLDGAILNDLNGINGASATGTTLGVDGIQEFRIITNSFSAEYGQSMGSQQVIVSKSGTNQFHGDAFEYLRNSALDARNFFDLPPSKLGGHRLPEFRRNNFGGAFGGPIRKDKTFFYGVYEQLVQVFGTTQIDIVPQAGCHGNAGDFITPGSGAGQCPLITTATQISAIMAPILALYPNPTPGLASNQYGFTYAQPTNEKYGQMRVDETLSANDSFFARYTGDHADQIIPFNFPNEVVTPLSSLNQFITLSETHIFSTRVLNAARFSFSRTNVYLQNQTSGITGPQYSFVQGLPMGSLTINPGITPLGVNLIADRRDKRNIFTWSDDLSYVRGVHALKFGVTVNHYQDYMMGLNNKFSAVFASFGQFLTGATGSSGSMIGQLGPLFDRTFHYDTMGFYVQDDWRANSRLTLNLGLRYEPETTLNAPSGLNPNCPQPTVPCEFSSSFRNGYADAGPTIGPPFNNPSLHNFSPRIGFAWNVFGDGKTAIRGGVARLYDLATWVPVVKLNAQSTPPFSSKFAVPNVTLSNDAATCGTFSFTCSPLPYIAPTNQPNLYTGAYWNMNQPQMYQYNLAVQRELPWGVALTVAYAGSSGLHLIQQRQMNPNIPNGVPSGGVCVAPPSGTTINLASQVDGTATSCFLPSTTRINPNTAVSSLAVSLGDGHSNYNALEVTLQKRLSKGFQLQSSYTWSRLIDNREAGQGADNFGAITTSGIDDLNMRTDRGPADFDLSDNWRTSAIYHVPNLTSSTGFLGKVVNGWGTSGILSVTSGYPFTVSLSSNRSRNMTGTAGADDRPDLIAGRNNSNMTSGVTGAACGSIPAGTKLGTPNLWFDPCAFTVQPIGFLGNAPRNMLRGPGFANLDFSVVKDTPIHKLGESGNLQFRAEIFNAFNHANFSIPANSTIFLGNLASTSTGVGTAYTAAQQSPAATAGVITNTVNKSRQIQFAVKVIF